MAKKKKKAAPSTKPAKKAARKAAGKKVKKGAAKRTAAKQAPAKAKKPVKKPPTGKKAARKVAPKKAAKKAVAKKAVKKPAAKAAAPSRMTSSGPRALNVAVILLPSADLQLVACPDNKVKVRVRVPAGSGFNECRAYVSANFGNACDATPTTTVNLPSVGGDEYEGLLDLGSPTQFQRFRICAYPSKNSGAQLGNPESRQFFASLAQTAPVSATASLWFGWTSGSATWGTHNEIPDNHQPVKIPIPTTPVRPTKVLVTASNDDWGHPTLSKADGYGSGELVQAQYHTLANITELSLAEARLNRLVGLFANPSIAGGAEIGFGLAETPANVPNVGETQFWLGHHDGHQWNNNTLSVTATYYWVST